MDTMWDFVRDNSNEITAISAALSALVVLGTAGYVIGQLREMRSTRHAQTIQWIYDIYTRDPRSLKAVRFVRSMEVLTWEEFRNQYPEREDDVRRIRQLIEYLGIMRYHRAIDEATLFGFFGDLIEVWGTKLRPLTRDMLQKFRYPIGPIFAEYVYLEWETWQKQRGLHKLKKGTVPDWPESLPSSDD